MNSGIRLAPVGTHTWCCDCHNNHLMSHLDLLLFSASNWYFVVDLQHSSYFFSLSRRCSKVAAQIGASGWLHNTKAITFSHVPNTISFTRFVELLALYRQAVIPSFTTQYRTMVREKLSIHNSEGLRRSRHISDTIAPLTGPSSHIALSSNNHILGFVDPITITSWDDHLDLSPNHCRTLVTKEMIWDMLNAFPNHLNLLVFRACVLGWVRNPAFRA